MPNTSEKKVVIVTGGSGYVGGAIVDVLLTCGWSVINASREESGVTNAEYVLCNIINEADVGVMVNKVLQKYGRIDACIHAAAAPIARANILDTPPEQFDSQYTVSVRGAYLLARAAIPRMKKGSVFIGVTTRSIEPTEKLERRIGAYLSSKQALRSLLRSLADELSPQGIRVYAVAPGFMPGGLNSDLPEGVRAILARQNDGTTAGPEEVGRLIADICTDPTLFPSGSSISLPSRDVSPL